MLASVQTTSIQQPSISSTPSVRKEYSCFLESMHAMSDSLKLASDDWEFEYDLMTPDSSLDSILELLLNAPDSFARGVVFGKLSALQAISTCNGRPLYVENPTAVSKLTPAYLMCFEELKNQGEWGSEYEDTVDFFHSSSSFDEVMSDMDTLLKNAPNVFCRGVVFGKMAMAIDIHSVHTD